MALFVEWNNVPDYSQQLVLFVDQLGATLVLPTLFDDACTASRVATVTTATATSSRTAAVGAAVETKVAITPGKEVVESAAEVAAAATAEEEEEEAIISQEPEQQDAVTTRIKVSCPALSLEHSITDRTSQKLERFNIGNGDHNYCANIGTKSPFLSKKSDVLRRSDCDIPQCDRKKTEAERHAEVLLKRPLAGFTFNDDKQQDSDGKLLSKTLLQNIYTSFAILVDSRLRAYSVFLARHALTISRTERNETTETKQRIQRFKEKLDAILYAGNELSVKAVVSRFILLTNQEAEGKQVSSSDVTTSVNSCEASSEVTETEFFLLVAMDCHIPTNYSGLSSSFDSKADRSFSVTFSAPGHINASFAAGSLGSVDIVVNTKELLTNMIQAASRVVSSVVQFASCCLQPSTSVKTTLWCGNAAKITNETCSDRVWMPTKINATPQEKVTIHHQLKQNKNKLCLSAICRAMPHPSSKRNLHDISESSDEDEALERISKCCIQKKYDGIASRINDMCPPYPPQSDILNLGLELLSTAALDQVHVVSPVVSAVGSNHSSSIKVPDPSYFELASSSHDIAINKETDKKSNNRDIVAGSSYEQHSNNVDVVSSLSPDECANIIDTCFLNANLSFGGFLSKGGEPDMTSQSQCNKRIKLCY